MDLVKELRKYHKDTHQHCVRVAEHMGAIAQAQQRADDEVRLLYQAGLLHDVGKLAVPKRILDKPGKLDTEEKKVIQLHPVVGFDLVRRYAPDVARIIVAHHEFQDDAYPRKTRRFSDPKIRDHAMLLAMCDLYDALASKRAYKGKIAQDKLKPLLYEQFGTHADALWTMRN
jgi:putative two-component system response regulator